MSHPELRPSVCLPAARAGVWRLAAGQVVGLRARRTRELRVVQGRVWVTTGSGQVAWRQGADWPASGDAVLRAGAVWQVPACTRVVVESWPEADGLPTRFEWVEPAGVPDRFTPKAVLRWLVGPCALAVKARWLKFAPSPGVLPHMGCGG